MSFTDDAVITAYGHGKTIDSIKINKFDNYSARRDYYNSINDFNIKEESWSAAKFVSENEQYPLEAFLPFDFDIILLLDDLSIQKLMREIDSEQLVKALLGASDEIKEKIFRNMTKRAARMLKDDMEYQSEFLAKVKEAQGKIISVIRHLEDAGEIVINYKKGEMAG
ncbi:flagellar motor switch protein FliG [Treponema sp. R8-4-B8]